MNYFAIPGLIRRKTYTSKHCVEAVSQYFKIPIPELFKANRKQEVVIARAFICYLLRRHTDMTFIQIGNFFGKNHSTIMYLERLAYDAIAHNGYKEKLPELYRTLDFTINQPIQQA